MLFRRYLSTFLCCTIFALVLGCGDGGTGLPSSGNDQEQQNSYPQVSYSGITTQATLSPENANKIFSFAWNGGPSSAESADSSKMISIRTLSNKNLFSSLDKPSDNKNQLKAVSRATTIDETINGSVSGTVKQSGYLNNDGTGLLSFFHTNFNDGDGSTLNGDQTYKINGYNWSYEAFTNIEISMNSFTTKSAEGYFTLSGDIHVETDFNTNIERWLWNASGRNEYSKETFKLENLIMVQTYDNILSPASFTETTTGRVYVESKGYVDVETVTPLSYSDYSQFNPDSGGPYLLTGAGGSQSKIVILSISEIRIEVDEDGDGIFEEISIHSWNDVYGVAIISIKTPPLTATYGENINFTLNAHKVDHNTVTFSKGYGPQGMQVDFNTGEVNWTPSQPMFGESVDVHWAVNAISGDLTYQHVGTFKVNDPGHKKPIVRSGIEVPNREKGLFTADFDGDGKTEILVTDNINLLYTVELNGEEYVQDWMYPFDLSAGEYIHSLAVYDINSDGHNEIIVSVGTKIVIIDGISKEISGTIDSAEGVHLSLEVADIDNDDNPEIIFLRGTDPWIYASENRTIEIYDALTLESEWQSAEIDFGRSIAVGNVDSDVALEIITSKGYVYDGLSHENEWAYGPGFGFLVDTGDLDNDGVEEIVGLDNWTAVRTYSLPLKSPLWEIPKDDMASLLVANIDDDPQSEIIVGDDQSGDVVAYDGITGIGLQEWSIDTQNGGVSSIAVGDTDNDGDMEFVWASGTRHSGPDSLVIAGLNPETVVEWTNEDGETTWGELQLDGPFIGACLLTTAPDEKRAVFATAETSNGYDGTRIISIDPITGLLDYSPEVGNNWSRRASLDGADYDNDGIDEVFLTTSELYDGYFTVYDLASSTTEWTSASDIGNGSAVTHSDLNGDEHDDFISVTYDGYINVYDVWNSTLIWKSTKLPGNNGIDIEIDDLDGDGVKEIIASSTDSISIYERSEDIYILRSLLTLPDVKHIDIGDVDLDGIPEIVALYSPMYSYNDPSGIVIYDGSSLEIEGNYSLSSVFNDVVIEPCLSTPCNLLIGVSEEGSSQYYNSSINILIMIDALTGYEIWRSPNLLGKVQPNSISFADVNNNGNNELLIGTSDAMYITQ